jgi:ABC-type transport system involved in multi-copper enzyme maturation permease subunit
MWQMRDYLAGPFVATVVITLALGMLPVIMFKAQTLPGAPVDPNALALHYQALVGVIGGLGSLIGAARLVSADRSPGLARMLFSKPVNPSSYYLQAWTVRGVTLAAFTLALGALVSLLLAPVDIGRGVAYVALAWLLVGGAGLLISALTAQDAGVFIGVYLLPGILVQLQRAYPGWTWLKPILTVMPPIHKLDDLRTGLLAGTTPQGVLLHVILYGVGCVALSMFVIRRLPLVR